MSDSLELTTTSPAETEALGGRVAALLPQSAVLALYGNLASGKTCFVTGLAAGLGATDDVSSPTFTLINEYHGRRRLHHMDLYRLSGRDELADLGVEEIFEGEGIALVEWAERAEGALPAVRLDIFFEHAGADLRRIRMENQGLLPEGWQEQLVFPAESGTLDIRFTCSRTRD